MEKPKGRRLDKTFRNRISLVMDNHTSKTVGSCVHCSHEGRGEMDCLFPLKMGHASSSIPSQAHVHNTHPRVKFRLNNFRGTE